MYLTHRVPFPPDKGDRIRNYHMLRQMAARGRVWLGCLADEPLGPDVEGELRRLCERVAVVPTGQLSRWVRGGWSLLMGRSLSEGAFASSGLRRVIREWAAETRFAAAVVSASSLAPYLQRDGLQDIPAFVDLVDVDSRKWDDFADASHGPKRWLYRLEAARVRKVERGLPRWTRAASVVSRAEADVYEAVAGSGTATVAPNGVDLDYFRPPDRSTDGVPSLGSTDPRDQPHSCAFVGALDYLPNVDAAVWFAREVWPAIREKDPAAEFRIIGRKPVPAVQTLETLPGVQVIGQVPDVRPFVASATVVVVPLRLARGIQNKVLEALAMGKPVIAAPPALVALKAQPGTHLLAATTPAEWASAVGELFADPRQRCDLGAAGRGFVEMHHHWDRCLEPMLNQIYG